MCFYANEWSAHAEKEEEDVSLGHGLSQVEKKKIT